MAEQPMVNKWMPDLDQQNRARVDRLMGYQIALGQQVYVDCFLKALMNTLDELSGAPSLDGPPTFSEQVATEFNRIAGEILQYALDNAASIRLQAPGHIPQNPKLN